MKTSLLSALSAGSLALAAPAQLAGPGLTWEGSSQNFASSFLPNCQNLPVTMVSPETVTVRVWGDIVSLYGLFASASGSQCVQIPGIGGGVILDAPFFPITAGVLNLVTPCLSCPPGFTVLQFAVPPGLPAGTSLALQAIGFGANNLSFTVAITGTV